MDNEYINPALGDQGNPETYNPVPNNAYPEYQAPQGTYDPQAPYQTPTPYDAYAQTQQAPYGNYNQPQAPYGGYHQPQAPYGGYGQPPYNNYGQPPAQNPYNYYSQPVYPTPQTSGSSRVFAILGMVFGIIGTSLCWFPVINFFTLLMSIAGIPFSAIGKKSGSGMATAGLVTSIIGTVLSFLFFTAYGGFDI